MSLCIWLCNVYCRLSCSYSVPNARCIAKQAVHDDSVTSVSVDDSDRFLLSGAFDGCVKLWTIKSNGLSSVPMAEFYEHEQPITCVALTGNATYAAAGAEDGKVVIWDVTSNDVVTTMTVGMNGK